MVGYQFTLIVFSTHGEIVKYNYTNDKTLYAIKEIILKEISPGKIILFGSRARGVSTSSSDYDILIIQKDLKNEREITRKLNYAFFENNIAVPVDLIAVDDKKWELDKNDIGMIYSKIYSEGITIYE